MVLAFLVRNWHRRSHVIVSDVNKREWDRVLRQYPDFQAELLCKVKMSDDERSKYGSDLSKYLEAMGNEG